MSKFICFGFTLAAILLSAMSSQADPILPNHSDSRWQDIHSISWSVDNGSTWGKDELFVGQSVLFQFVMHKDYKGTHYADLLKAWIDWDDNGFDSDESIIFDKHVVWDNPVQNQFPGENVDEYYRFQTTTGLLLTNDHLGDHWLLARVTCSESLIAGVFPHNWNTQWDNGIDYNSYFLPNKSYNQGEAELYKLTVNPVPEPASILLFGAGLAGLAGIRLRSKK